MHIGAIMQDKGNAVHSTRPDASLHSVVEQLLSRRISCLVVLSEDGGLAGIITEKDIVRTLGRHPDNWQSVRVEEVMTRELYTAGFEAPLDEVITQMRERHIRHLPVVEGGVLSGVLSIRDMIKASMTELERHNQMLKRFIGNWPEKETSSES